MKKPAKTIAWVLGGIITLFIVIGIANSPTTPTATTTVTPAQAAQEPVSAAPAAVVDPRVAIAAWWTGGGQDRVSAIGTDFGNMGAAGAATDPIALSAACTALQTDVESAQAYASLPDTVAQTHWSAALAQAARSATDCIAGTRRLDADLIDQSARELNAATAEISKVTERINALHNSTPG